MDRPDGVLEGIRRIVGIEVLFHAAPDVDRIRKAPLEPGRLGRIRLVAHDGFQVARQIFINGSGN